MKIAQEISLKSSFRIYVIFGICVERHYAIYSEISTFLLLLSSYFHIIFFSRNSLATCSVFSHLFVRQFLYEIYFLNFRNPSFFFGNFLGIFWRISKAISSIISVLQAISLGIPVEVLWKFLQKFLREFFRKFVWKFL